jgi:hypothetical protein
VSALLTKFKSLMVGRDPSVSNTNKGPLNSEYTPLPVPRNHARNWNVPRYQDTLGVPS